MSEADTDGSYLTVPDDYVEALRELGGEATSEEIAEQVDRHFFTVNRALDPERDDTPESVTRKKVGGAYLYRIVEDEDADSARDDEAQEGEDV